MAEQTQDITQNQQSQLDENVVAEPVVKAVKDSTDFRAGDTVKVHYRIVEGDKSRVQPFEGIVISKRGVGSSKTFTVRRIGADNVAIERIFPLSSPNIQKIDVLKRGKVRRAKLYYIREKVGKAAKRVKEQK